MLFRSPRLLAGRRGLPAWSQPIWSSFALELWSAVGDLAATGARRGPHGNRQLLPSPRADPALPPPCVPSPAPTVALAVCRGLSEGPPASPGSLMVARPVSAATPQAPPVPPASSAGGSRAWPAYRAVRSQVVIGQMQTGVMERVSPVPGNKCSRERPGEQDRKSTRLNSSHRIASRMPSSA